MPDSPYMTRREAAEYLRCSVETVDRRAIERRWRYDRDGLRVLFYREDVEASLQRGFVRSRGSQPPALTLNRAFPA